MTGILHTLWLAVRGAREQVGYWVDRVRLARSAVLCAWNGHLVDVGEDDDPAAGRAFQEYDEGAQEMTGLAGIEYQLEACRRCGEVYVSDTTTVMTNPCRQFRPRESGRVH